MTKHIMHATDTFDKLSSILNQKGFRLSYCKEDFCLGHLRVSRALHPMVCFSEYDLDAISNQTITYGRYGIALSNDWKNRKKIHPVIYIDKESVVAGALATLLRARRYWQTSKLPRNLRLPIMTVKCFTKNAIGENSHTGDKDFDFRAENEWRYVPTKKQIGGYYISLNKRDVDTEEKLREHNLCLQKYPLRFDVSDVERIYVKTEEEMREIQDWNLYDAEYIQLSDWKTN